MAEKLTKEKDTRMSKTKREAPKDKLSKRRKDGKLEMKGSQMGIGGFMSLVEGGILPRGFNVAVAGPVGSGKSTIALSFIYDGLKNGEGGFVLSTDEPGSRVRENMIALGMDTTKYERKGKMTFFDAYGGTYASGKYKVWFPDDPRMIAYLMDRWWQEKKHPKFRWCIDSLTTLYTISDPVQMQEFLWDRVRKSKLLNATCFYTITQEAHDEKTLSNIFNMMDKIGTTSPNPFNIF